MSAAPDRRLPVQAGPCIDLHTGGVPGMPPLTEMPAPEGRVLRNIGHATLTPYLPPPGQATGTGVIVLPGGGFKVLAVDLEGHPVARALAERGVAAFVLQYRLRPPPADPVRFGQEMATFMDGLARGEAEPDLSVPPQSLDDLRAALALLRAQAPRWGLAPARLGVMGFSAGALTAMAHTLGAPADEQPAFLASLYGPLSLPPGLTALPATLPPLYAALAADDPLFARRGLGLVEQWQRSGHPVECHLLQAGGHGYGLGRPGTTTANWLAGFTRWLHLNGWLATLPHNTP